MPYMFDNTEGPATPHDENIITPTLPRLLGDLRLIIEDEEEEYNLFIRIYRVIAAAVIEQLDSILDQSDINSPSDRGTSSPASRSESDPDIWATARNLRHHLGEEVQRHTFSTPHSRTTMTTEESLQQMTDLHVQFARGFLEGDVSARFLGDHDIREIIRYRCVLSEHPYSRSVDVERFLIRIAHAEVMRHRIHSPFRPSRGIEDLNNLALCRARMNEIGEDIVRYLRSRSSLEAQSRAATLEELLEVQRLLIGRTEYLEQILRNTRSNVRHLVRQLLHGNIDSGTSPETEFDNRLFESMSTRTQRAHHVPQTHINRPRSPTLDRDIPQIHLGSPVRRSRLIVVGRDEQLRETRETHDRQVENRFGRRPGQERTFASLPEGLRISLSYMSGLGSPEPERANRPVYVPRLTRPRSPSLEPISGTGGEEEVQFSD